MADKKKPVVNGNFHGWNFFIRRQSSEFFFSKKSSNESKYNIIKTSGLDVNNDALWSKNYFTDLEQETIEV